MPDPVAPATAAASLYGETPAPAPEPAATPAVEAAVVPTPEPAPVPAPTAEATPAEPPVPAEPAAALEFKPDFKECDIPEYNDVHKIDYAVLEDEFERDELSPHHRDLISRKSLVLANELREFLTGSSDYADYHNTSKQKLFAKFLYHSSREPLFQRDLIAMCLRFYQIIIFADKEEVLNDLTIIRQRMKKCLCYNSNEEAEIVLQAIRYTLESEDLDIRDCWKKLNGMLSSEFTSIIQDLYEGQL